MDKERLPISVIIPTMNRPDTLKRTVKSFMAGRSIPDEIVIIDQSTVPLEDDTLIKHWIDESICLKYIKQTTPSSTRARNLGIGLCENDIILFSDDDIDMYDDTLQNMYRLMSEPTSSMVGAIDDNTDYRASIKGYIAGVRSFCKRKIGNVSLSFFGRYPKNLERKELVKTEWCMGYFFAVKKSLLDKWSIQFDENLVQYAYAEDLDFSYAYFKQANKENLRCLLSGDVRVKHLVSKEYRTPTKKSTYMFVLHRYYLIYKHKMGMLSFLAATYANFMIYVERYIKRENASDILRAMQIYFKNRHEINMGNIEKYLSD